MEKVDQAYLSEIVKSQEDGKDKGSVNDVRVPESNTSLEEIEVFNFLFWCVGLTFNQFL